MGHVIVFNLYLLLNEIWVPEAWLAELDQDGRPRDLLRRISKTQMVEWNIQAEDYVIRLLEWCEKLQYESLDENFSRTVKRKRVSLKELWAEKEIRLSIEKYITRHLDQFYQLGQKHEIWLSRDAATKPILSHHLLSFAPSPVTGTLHLSKHDNGLTYQLVIRDDQNQKMEHASILPLVYSTPGWFAHQNSIYRLPGISGKMLLPFRDKEELEVRKQHERTWYHQFLKKNIDRDAQVATEGFRWEEQTQLNCSQISFFSHLFDGRLLMRLQFEYPDAQFLLGDRQQIRSKIIIPEAMDEEVRIVKIIRNEAQEQATLDFLQSLGLALDYPHFYWPESDALSDLVHFLRENNNALKEHGIFCEYNHPESRAPLALDPPVVVTNTKKSGDWFDLTINIQIGSRQIPFRALVDAIRRRSEFFQLPDGSVFLIPPTWHTRYRELADFMSVQNDEADSGYDACVRLHAMQSHLLEALDLQPANTNSSSLPSVALTTWEGAEWVKANLRPYQEKGVLWILNLWQQTRGACLADDMGLGKTLQAIAALGHHKQLKKAMIPVAEESLSSPACQLSLFDTSYTQTILPLQALLVVPASLVYNWKQEIKKFAPGFFVYCHTGPKRSKDSRALLAHDIVLTTYHTLREDSDWMVPLKWEFVILDESQHIKNRSSDISRTVRKLQAGRRLALSGTPVENNLSELWSLFNFVNAPLLGSYQGFQHQYQNPIEKDGNTEVKSRLRELIAPYFLRRRKNEVAPELPPLTRQVLWVELDARQAELYEKTKSAARNELLAIEPSHEYTFQALRILMKLRQTACHPALVGAEDLPSGKMMAVLEEFQQIHDQGSKVLVFSSFEKHLSLYSAWLEAQGYHYAWLSGSSSQEERRSAVEKFQEDPEVTIFLITLKAGGTGLNLTAADYVFLLDPWWNPHAEEQAIARAHRIGQDKPVHVIRFIASATIEEKILHLQADKWQLNSGLIDDELPPLTREEIRSLL
ncbi:MAG: SNF2 helicase associated domain-containing protein [Lewinellaceae bacterium]|nr:SNF2 helicase associated domain-containing protein [Lewinellaceae bacterium]